MCKKIPYTINHGNIAMQYSKRQKMTKILGYIAYEGPSEIDGAPIVVIVNKINDASKNGKTGDIVQSFIIRSDVNPVEALQTGADDRGKEVACQEIICRTACTGP